MAVFTYEEKMTKEDGTEIKILSKLYIDYNSKYYTDTIVHYRKQGETDWTLCKNHSKFSHAEIKTMPREQYIREGRPEIFELLGIGKILKVLQELLDAAKAKYPDITPLKPFGGSQPFGCYAKPLY